jgi:hypothetical protein
MEMLSFTPPDWAQTVAVVSVIPITQCIDLPNTDC